MRIEASGAGIQPQDSRAASGKTGSVYWAKLKPRAMSAGVSPSTSRVTRWSVDTTGTPAAAAIEAMMIAPVGRSACKAERASSISQNTMSALRGVTSVSTELVWEPPWDPSRIAPEALKRLEER